LAGTEAADRIVWSAIDFSGAGILLARAIAIPAASRAFSWATNLGVSRAFDMVTSGSFMPFLQAVEIFEVKGALHRASCPACP
jgi:hypothetical protein